MPIKRSKCPLFTSLWRRCHAQSNCYFSKKLRPGRAPPTPKVSFPYLERFRRYLAKTRNFLARCAPFWQFTPWPPLPPAPRFFIQIWHFTDTPSKKRIFRIGRAVSEIPHFGGRKILPYEYKDTSLINTPLPTTRKTSLGGKMGAGGSGVNPQLSLCRHKRSAPYLKTVYQWILIFFQKSPLPPSKLTVPHPLPFTLPYNNQCVPLPQPGSRIYRETLAMRTPVEPAICL